MNNIKIEVTDHHLYQTTCQVYTEAVSKYQPQYSPMITIDFDFIRNSVFLDCCESKRSAWKDVREAIEDQIQRQLEQYEEEQDVKILNHRKLVKDIIETCDNHLKNLINI
jgi:HD-like signal output (HDOD) protein